MGRKWRAVLQAACLMHVMSSAGTQQISSCQQGGVVRSSLSHSLWPVSNREKLTFKRDLCDCMLSGEVNPTDSREILLAIQWKYLCLWASERARSRIQLEPPYVLAERFRCAFHGGEWPQLLPTMPIAGISLCGIVFMSFSIDFTAMTPCLAHIPEPRIYNGLKFRGASAVAPG